MAKISPLQAAEQGIEFLRQIRDRGTACLSTRDEAPQADCECYTCKLLREANNIVDRYDGEDV